jgi:hypothetical protein
MHLLYPACAPATKKFFFAQIKELIKLTKPRFAFINQTKTDCTVLSQSWSSFEAFEVLYFFKF